MLVAPDWSILSLAAVVCAAAAFTPGPNNTICMSIAANYGFRRAVPFCLGVTVGFPLLVLLTGAGLGVIILQAPQLHQFIKIIGVLFLLYMAWKIATASQTQSRQDIPGFINAVLFQWLNPKALIYALSTVASFTRVGETLISDIFYLVLLTFLISLGSTFTWSIGGVAISRFLKTARALKLFNRIMGVLLALSAIGILFV